MDNLTDKQIDDLMVTALEGGINYWCGRAKLTKFPENCIEVIVSNAISMGGEITLTDLEDEDESWVLTKEKFIKGAELCKGWAGCKSYEELFDNHDAETADVLIQFAVMGDIVFG